MGTPNMESMTWIAVVMSAIAMIDSITTKLLSFFSNDREKQRALALALKTAEMDKRVTKQEDVTGRVSEEVRQWQIAHSQCNEQLVTIREQLAAARAEHTSTESRVASVEKSIVTVAAALPAILPPPSIQLPIPNNSSTHSNPPC